MKKTLTYLAAAFVTVGIVLYASLPSILHNAGLHPDYEGPKYEAPGKRALIITTSHGILAPVGEEDGPATGVFASEMTHPYYTFSEAGMQVDIASIKGGEIPIDPQSFYRPIISTDDKRFLEDDVFQAKAKNSIPIDEVDITSYDVVFLAGGWGAAYDMIQSETLAKKVTQAYYGDRSAIIGGVCHGVLGLAQAKDAEGQILIAGRRMTGVTNKQLEELGIEVTPKHPETELRKAGALFESSEGFRDILQTHVVVDDEERFVTGQNQNSGLETAHKMIGLLAKRNP